MNTTARLTPTEKALIERGIEPYAYSTEFDGRDDSEQVRVACGRCGGAGILSMYVHLNGGVCFECDGIPYSTTTVGELRRKDRERTQGMNRNMLRNEKERAARVAKANAERAEAEAKRAAFLAQHEGLEDVLKAVPGDFGASLRIQLNDRGSLSEKQVAAARRVAAEQAERAAAPAVVEGRGVLTGVVKSTKWVDNDFGGALKMTLADDRGFVVFGTVPNAIADDVEAGDRVTFTARVEQSRNDASFGFYSRPSKASII